MKTVKEQVMKKYISTALLLCLLIVGYSCKEKKNDDAIAYLSNIKSLYEKGSYEQALSDIDSLPKYFPKAYPEIKESLALKQDIRKAYDTKQIADCDSLIAVYEPQIDSLKKLFVYKKEKDDDKGFYVPKTMSSDVLTATLLRAGVEDGGAMYLESVFLGGQYHNVIEAKSKDGSSAETKPINDEGVSFRFVHMGKQYEVLKATSFHDNGLASFIVKKQAEPITITLKGKNTNSFGLGNVSKKAIVDSYNLSSLILRQDSLREAKTKASYRIKYVDEQIQKVAAQKLENQEKK